jgi:signal recognition particle receptor subunit beta
MVQFNFAERTIRAKVVYYGPPQSGKTTNLEQIHRLTDPAGVNRLVSLNTAQDRTLFFDLLPFSLGAVGGYDFKVQLYTVPGQVQYNATRRVVLAGADAVVFVVDSQRDQLKENVTALENMKVNLLANRLVPERMPLVLQYNKRDLPGALSQEELDRALNPWRRRAFTAVAAEGQGVLDVFLAVVQEMLSSIAVKYNLKEKGLDPAAVPGIVAEAFEAIGRKAASTPPPAEPVAARLVVTQPVQAPAPAASAPATPESGGVVSEELLQRAIRSNVELAEALAGLVQEMNQGLGAILSHAELSLMYRDDAREKRAAAVGSIQQEAQRLRRVIQALGQATSAASLPPPASFPTTGSSAPMRDAAPAPPPGDDLSGLLKAVGQDLGPALAARQLTIDFQVPNGAGLPSGPRATVQRALTGLLGRLAETAGGRSSLVLRFERKPVLIRTREGDVRRDFLMLAVSQQGGVTPDEQSRISHGDAAVAGGCARLLRDMGAFVRFVALPGGLETRVFLPTT